MADKTLPIILTLGGLTLAGTLLIERESGSINNGAVPVPGAPSQSNSGGGRALELAIDIIGEFEGFRENAYLDVAGIPTVGYGFTRLNGRAVRLGDRIDRESAKRELRRLVKDFMARVKASIKVPVTDGQLAALTSLAYNIGLAGFKSSTTLRELNKGNYEKARQAMALWNKSNVNGRLQVVSGLIRRRRDEQRIFNS